MIKYKFRYNYYLSFIITATILSVLLFAFGGSNVFLGNTDVNYQYLDFFGYYKDVLFGRNSINYTFSKGLGGTSIGVFSYYLASPINLLVVFFKRSQLVNFLSIISILKLSIASSTFSIFLKYRFKDIINKSNINNIIVIALSVGYALSQYSLVQIHNIMWIDSVYMLPLVLMGIYKLIQKQKTLMLSITIALTMLFNWYMGCTVCLFSAIWLFIEIAIHYSEEKSNTTNKFKEFILYLIRYAYAMIIGLGVSAILFLPTIVAFKNSGRDDMAWYLLKNIGFLGPIYNVVESYSMGAVSSIGNVSLFCGSIAIIGLITAFFNKKIVKKTKIIIAFIVIGMLLLFYWNPPYVLFSLIKEVPSFNYRYSFVGIFIILFISGYSLLQIDWNRQKNLFIKISLIFAGLMILINILAGRQSRTNVLITALCMVVIGLLLTLYSYFKTRNSFVKKVFMALICFSVLVEGIVGSSLFLKTSEMSSTKEYEEYVTNQEKQIDSIKSMDKSSYRINQLDTRHMGEYFHSANYNESLNYNYWSIPTYTSNPDGLQMEFLDKLGYRRFDLSMCAVRTSILPADSLLGTKYLLSSFDINGWEKADSLGINNSKAVYKNPYVLPMAFTYKEDGKNIIYNDNPFEYQNNLYSKLLGKQIKIFIPLKHRVVKKGNTSLNEPLEYKIDVPKGDYSLYGNIVTNSNCDGVLKANGGKEILYSKWGASSVFYIPTESNDQIAKVVMKAKKYDVNYGKEQFYAVDLNVLHKATSELKAGKATKMNINNGNAEFIVQGSKKENLLLAVPYDDGWTITLNGQNIEPQKFAETMFSIPLKEGTNVIKMEYHIKGLIVGILISIASLILLICIYVLEKRHNKDNE